MSAGRPARAEGSAAAEDSQRTHSSDPPGRGGRGRGAAPGRRAAANPPPGPERRREPVESGAGRGRDRNLERDSGKRLRGGGVRPVPAPCPRHPSSPALPRPLGLAVVLGVPASGAPAAAGLRRHPSAPLVGARDQDARGWRPLRQ